MFIIKNKIILRLINGLAKHIWLILLLLIFSLFALYKIGSVSFTWDEQVDFNIVSCLVEFKNPFACTYDITQTRLVYYIYALFNWFNGLTNNIICYLVSYVFAVFNIILMYLFTFKEFGKKTAIWTAVLMASSIPLLCSSRMILTHSNVVFTTFTILTIISLYFYFKEQNKAYFFLSSIFWGLSVACNILGAFTLIFVLLFYIFNSETKFKIWQVLYVPIAMIIFFLTTIIYLTEDNLLLMLKNTTGSHSLYYFNYFNLGLNYTPWWFSLLIFVVKISPWWIIFYLGFIKYFNGKKTDLRLNFLKAFYFFSFVYLLLKSGFFQYAAPHHQVQLYPFVYLIIAVVMVDIFQHLKYKWAWQVLYSGLIAVFLAVQIIFIILFFPNYLFYGAQYGKAFIGEFYGPAVAHCQDIYPVRNKLLELTDNNESILVLDRFCLHMTGAGSQWLASRHLIYFSQINENNNFHYAFWDYVHEHLQYEVRDEYEKYLNSQCEEVYTYYFPMYIRMYAIYKCK